MTALFYISGFFGLLCSGCAFYGLLRRDDSFVFALGCVYAFIAALYFVVGCIAVAFA